LNKKLPSISNLNKNRLKSAKRRIKTALAMSVFAKPNKQGTHASCATQPPKKENERERERERANQKKKKKIQQD
jgi:hypothetical protein